MLEQPRVYSKDTNNKEIAVVQSQQNAARVICAQLVGLATALKFVGASRGLRCFGLAPVPANPQGAVPVTELDAPGIHTAVALNGSGESCHEPY